MKMEKVPGIWLALCAAAYLTGALACAVFAAFPFTVGYMLGGALALANSWASTHKLRKSGFSDRGRAWSAVVGGFYFRMLILGVCLYALLTYIKVDPVGLIAGLSVVPAGMLLMPVLIYLANRGLEEA